MKSKASVSGMDGHTGRSDTGSVSVYPLGPWPGTQEDGRSDSELGAGSESDSNTDIATSTKGPRLVNEDACAWIWNAFRKTELEPVECGVITPEQGHRVLSLQLELYSLPYIPSPAWRQTVPRDFTKYCFLPIGPICAEKPHIDPVDPFWHIIIPTSLHHYRLSTKNHHGKTSTRWECNLRHR